MHVTTLTLNYCVEKFIFSNNGKLMILVWWTAYILRWIRTGTAILSCIVQGVIPLKLYDIYTKPYVYSVDTPHMNYGF